MMIPQLMIAAPCSGSGKTTVARGLMALLRAEGMEVQPFKCGPDYIDTKFHGAVCARPSVNLDTFMASEAHVRRLYGRYSGGADVCIAEGMMGLYDGYERDKGSSAAIAATLRMPVVLVADARSMAYSVAPLLSGFARFRTGVRIAGVIFNKVGSQRHFSMLQEACSDAGIECFGYLPKAEELATESRYLGLDFSRSVGYGALVQMLQRHVDWRRILEKTEAPAPAAPAAQPAGAGQPAAAWRIAVARSAEAFSFVYQEHLDQLHRMGTVTFFDPEADCPIPSGTDLLYLPGGYPENRLGALQQASRTRSSIAEYAARGGRILAECGGMMYLCRSVITGQGGAEMCGVLPYSVTARKGDRKLSLGYRQFSYRGLELRGHEFHYTRFAGAVPPSAAQMYDARRQPVDTPLIRVGNVIASYTHLYWGGQDIKQLF